MSLDKSLINLKVVLLESETNASFFEMFFQHYQLFLERLITVSVMVWGFFYFAFSRT